MKIVQSLVLCCAILFWAQAAQAYEIKLGHLIIHQPWIKQPPNGAKVAGAYVTIQNTGKEDDTLISASLQGVTGTQIHEMKMQGDVMQMSEFANGLVIPAGKSVELKPKSNHIMLMGLKNVYSRGEQVKGTLTFAKSGKVEVDFAVLPATTQAPVLP